ncbi:MAG TPA: hypothetical protein VEI07_20100, partial [Planctomycetaceae bacterium]|nr:hypothetical protein [Planctomycetaceae bacterium]
MARIGVSPNYHWLIKHVTWLGLAVAATFCLLGLDQFLLKVFFTPGFTPRTLWATAQRVPAFAPGGFVTADEPGFVTTAGTVAFYVLLVYSLGHLLSSVIPSGMTSLVLGIIGWIGVALLWMLTIFFEVPFWWTIGLVPLIFLFAGWVRTQDWLVDRNSLAAWGRFAASLVVPVVAVFCCVAVFRVVEIPAVSLPIELRTPPPAVDEPPLKPSLFVDALKALTEKNPAERPIADDWEHFDFATKYWVDANTAARQLALKAAQQPPGDLQGIWGKTTYDTRGDIVIKTGSLVERVNSLSTLLLDSARKLESEGKLDEALENYVALARFGDDLVRSGRRLNHSLWGFWTSPTWKLALDGMDRWAAHPKQTTELIKRAIDRFRRFQEERPLVSPKILHDWRIEREMFVDFVWKGNNPNVHNRVVAEMGIVRWCLPWELLRLKRVQDAMFSRALDETQLAERELHDRRFVDATLLSSSAKGVRPWRWAQTTLEPPLDSPNGLRMESEAPWPAEQAAWSHLHFLVWAAADYRREHHRLPAALAELVPTYFAALPIDPWTGRNFQYEPQGVPARLHPAAGAEIEEKQPFIASAGPRDCEIVVSKQIGGWATEVRVLTRSGRELHAHSQQVPLDFPGPALAIPSVPGERKAFNSPPDKPAGKPGNAPRDNLPKKP